MVESGVSAADGEGEPVDWARQRRFDLLGEPVDQHLVLAGHEGPSTFSTTRSGLIFLVLSAATISVSTKPTCTPSTWVPCPASSRRRELLSDHRAAFDAP